MTTKWWKVIYSYKKIKMEKMANKIIYLPLDRYFIRFNIEWRRRINRWRGICWRRHIHFYCNKPRRSTRSWHELTIQTRTVWRHWSHTRWRLRWKIKKFRINIFLPTPSLSSRQGIWLWKLPHFILSVEIL